MTLSRSDLIASESPGPGWYATIPGVTADEVAAIERLREERPDGFVYGMLLSDEAFPHESGKVGGFTGLITNHLSDLFGIPFRAELMAWDTLIDDLDAYRLDFTGELTASPERLERYFMTGPIAERSFAVYYRADKPKLDMINSDVIRRYGFLVGVTSYDRVRETSEVDFEPVFYQNYEIAAKAILDGSIDAFVVEAMADSIFQNYPEIIYHKYYPVAFTSVSLTTANPDLQPILSVFQKYLDSGGTDVLVGLYAEGTREYHRHKLRKQLTADEVSYIDEMVSSRSAIPILAEFDSYPVSFYNTRDQEWQGIAHDILAELSYLTGLTFTVVNQPNEPWEGLFRRLENGEAVLMTQLLLTKNRNKRYLWTEEPYMLDNYALLSLSSTPDIPIQRVRNVRVGLLRDTAYEEIFHRIFPNHPNVVQYDTTIEAFNGLDCREVDVVMLSRNLLLGVTNLMERPDFKVNLPFELPCNSHFGFPLGEERLRGIVDTAQGVIDYAAISDKWQRRVFDYRKKMAEARIPYLVGILFLLIVLFFFATMVFIGRVRRSAILSLTDHLTMLPNRRWFDEQLRLEWKNAIKYRHKITLFTIDVDHFKRYNDTYGHPEGDTVLKTIADIFRNTVRRTSDRVARIGGEEFCVILPGTDEGNAFMLAERMRNEIANASIVPEKGGDPHRVTVSIGIATMAPTPRDKKTDLVSRSDKALYKAKSQGRNMVCIG